MTHRLTTNCAKNYCNRTLIVKVIVENVVTCFLGGHGVIILIHNLQHKSTISRPCTYWWAKETAKYTRSIIWQH